MFAIVFSFSVKKMVAQALNSGSYGLVYTVYFTLKMANFELTISAINVNSFGEP